MHSLVTFEGEDPCQGGSNTRASYYYGRDLDTSTILFQSHDIAGLPVTGHRLGGILTEQRRFEML